MSEMYAKLKDGRYLVRYRKPKSRWYFKPALIDVKDGKAMLVVVEERLVPGMMPRVDLCDTFSKVSKKRRRHYDIDSGKIGG